MWLDYINIWNKYGYRIQEALYQFVELNQNHWSRKPCFMKTVFHQRINIFHQWVYSIKWKKKYSLIWKVSVQRSFYAQFTDHFMGKCLNLFSPWPPSMLSFCFHAYWIVTTKWLFLKRLNFIFGNITMPNLQQQSYKHS